MQGTIRRESQGRVPRSMLTIGCDHPSYQSQSTKIWYNEQSIQYLNVSS